MPYALPGSGAPLGLLTDLYELRMAQTYVHEGMTAPAVFSLYIRPTPDRPWFVAAGTGHAIEILDRFVFGTEEIDYLARSLALDDDFLGWLSELELEGELHAVADGTIVLGDEPLLEFTAPLPIAQLLETLLMNVVHFPTLIATKAARCRAAAGDRTLADFGARRAHDIEAAVEAARAAYLGGFDATSNVEAGRRFGIPVVGTMAHSFIQAFDDELAAFRAFAADHPGNAVMLVDTYDSLEGVDNAIRVGQELRRRGGDLQGIRLDSGDLAALAKESRRRLDDAGFNQARIFASGGIDEWGIRDLVAADAPIDAFGIGTSLTTSRDHPAVDIAYKLVEYDGVARAKYSVGKELLPGAKQVFRRGSPENDLIARRGESAEGDALLEAVWRDGHRLLDDDLEQARERAAAGLAALPESWLDPDGPSPPPTVRVSDGLAKLAADTRERELS